MCFTGESMDKMEQFVDLALKKRVRNKRKRDPDMCMEVLLTSTVRRLRCKMVNEPYYAHQAAKRLRISSQKDEEVEEPKPEAKSETSLEKEVQRAVESLQEPADVIANSDSSLIQENSPLSPENIEDQGKSFTENLHNTTAESSSGQFNSKTDCTNYDDIDFDVLLQNLLEICEPLSCNVDELMQDYSLDPSMSGTLDLINNNDPFLPGMFEVMCS